jgi:hypothetical protein
MSDQRKASRPSGQKRKARTTACKEIDADTDIEYPPKAASDAKNAMITCINLDPGQELMKISYKVVHIISGKERLISQTEMVTFPNGKQYVKSQLLITSNADGGALLTRWGCHIDDALEAKKIRLSDFLNHIKSAIIGQDIESIRVAKARIAKPVQRIPDPLLKKALNDTMSP